MYPEWYVHLGRDGWIVGYWLNDPNPANQQSPRAREFMGREWMEAVAGEIGAKGGSVKYSVEGGEGEPPPIVLTMINFMSETLNERLEFVELDPANQPGKGGESDEDLTVLMRKAREGNLAWVQDVIERGGDLEATDGVGCTALMHAAYAGHLEIVQALLEAGADPNRGSKKGNTALMMAVQCPVQRHDQRQELRAEIARALLARRADPNVVNKEKQTALDLCDRNDQRVIFILREFDAQYASELEPWWDSPWFKYPVAGVFAVAFGVFLFWFVRF
jgi:hypothetical protein